MSNLKWAGVIFDNNTKAVVPVKNIKKFDFKTHSPQKCYKIIYQNKSYLGFIKFLTESKDDASEKMKRTRISMPPKSKILSASESDPEKVEKQSKEFHNNSTLKVSLDKRTELLKTASNQRTQDKSFSNENLPPAKRQKLQKDSTLTNPKKSQPKNSIPSEDEDPPQSEEENSIEQGKSALPEVLLNSSYNKSEKPKVRSDELLNDPISFGNSTKNSVQKKEEINSPHQEKIETLSEALNKIRVLRQINNDYQTKLRVKDNMILIKNKELQDLKVKYEETIERNIKLQVEVIGGQKLILEGLKNIKASGIDNESEVKIGFIDENNGKAYLGNGHWITTNFYHTLMAIPRVRVLVENLARHIFGDEVLLKSTVSGKTSNRSKNKSDEVCQLDPELLSRTRGFFEHYLRNSVFAHGMPESMIFKHLGSLERYISKFIAKLKGKTFQNEDNKVEKQPSPLPEKSSDAEQVKEVDVRCDNDAKEDISDDLSDHYDSEDSTPLIINEDE
ncbi:BEN domain-containing protein 5-like [Microplitis mediator]|uniref:BEN domain-containing protein 5-like n=1 Tax=Microplitis mediator TaxID=375433 RepID=UPI0025560E90|nr:BEN domain-containing protein 5-like [Microplitis mediator]